MHSFIARCIHAMLLCHYTNQIMKGLISSSRSSHASSYTSMAIGLLRSRLNMPSMDLASTTWRPARRSTSIGILIDDVNKSLDVFGKAQFDIDSFH